MAQTGLQDFPGTVRFSVERCLGIGGFGAVYQARDLERKISVALKTLTQLDAQTLYLFKQEFRALADITHPNLVTLYELFADGSRWFFTMELVEGLTFLEYVCDYRPAERSGDRSSFIPVIDYSVKSSPGARVCAPVLERVRSSYDPERLTAALKQLAEGIHTLHSCGKLHCDIKPSNVLVTSAGRVVILDFGLVTELSRQRQGQVRAVFGTPNYMAPEHVTGVPLTPASDWYSFGVILYEALTGCLPYDEVLGSVLVQKLSGEPPPPSELAPGIPHYLDLLCRDLLRVDPRLRPAGSEVLQRLGVVSGQQLALHVNIAQNLPWIGRVQQLGALMEAFEASRRGSAITIFVQGKSGMGKSSMVRRFLDELRQRESDLLVLDGRCYKQESVPYKVFDSIIDSLSQYLKDLSHDELAELMPADALAVARLFPVLLQAVSNTGNDENILDIQDSVELRRRAFASLRELFARLAKKRAVVLFIDDLQWGDLDSAALLAEILRPPEPPPILLIGSYRAEDITSSKFLKAILSLQEICGADTAAREIMVDALTAAESKLLARAIIGADRTDADTQAEVIALEARGCPFIIEALARTEDAVSTLTEMDDTQSSTESGIFNILSNAALARALKLPPEAQRLLEIVAVAGQPLESALAKQAAETDGDADRALALLRTRHLIRSVSGDGQDEFDTYHDRIRETVLAQLSPEAARRYHAQLAKVLTQAEQVDPERLAIHFKGAGDYPQAINYAVIAAERANEALAFDHAARLYQMALELSDDEEARQDLRIKMAGALAKAGRGSEAGRAYRDAAEKCTGNTRLELQRRAAEQFLYSGHVDDGVAILETLLTSMGMSLAKSPLRAFCSYLLNQLILRLRGLKYQARSEAEIDAQELMRIDTCWSVAAGLSVTETIRVADFQTRNLLLALKAGEQSRIVRALCLQAAYSSLGGGRTRRRTEQLINEAARIAELINEPYSIGFVKLEKGVVGLMEGRWQDSWRYSDEAIELLSEKCTGVTWELSICQLFSLRAICFMGQLKVLSRRLPAIFTAARERGNLYDEINLHSRVSYLLALAADNPQRAGQEVRGALERWSHKGFLVQHYFYFVARTEEELYTGDALAAWGRVQRYWPALKRTMILFSQLFLIEASHLRARSALAALSRAPDGKMLLRTAEHDAGRIEREKMPYGNALALLIRAGIAAARGNDGVTIQLLAAAESALKAADMALYAMAARRQRGLLIGGDEGRRLVESAEAWMRDQHIINPARMTEMLVPLP